MPYPYSDAIVISLIRRHSNHGEITRGRIYTMLFEAEDGDEWRDMQVKNGDHAHDKKVNKQHTQSYSTTILHSLTE
jgi:hypothetical protein